MTIRDRAQAALDRCKAATPRPWHTADDIGTPSNIDDAEDRAVALAQMRSCLGRPDPERASNARFIAHARTDVEDLSAALLRILSPEMREQIARTLYGGGCLSPDQAEAKADDVMRLIERVAEEERR